MPRIISAAPPYIQALPPGSPSSRANSAPTKGAVEDQQSATGGQEPEGEDHAAVERLAVPKPSQSRGEYGLQCQHQRCARSARVLQAPRQRHRSHGGAEERHEQQARRISSLDPRLALAGLAQQGADDRSPGVKQGRRGQAADACTEALNEWRADAEQKGRQERC